MIITHEITFDLRRRGLMPWVDAVLDDSYSRAVAVGLTVGDEPWEVPEGVTAAVRYRKSDGTVGLYDTLPDSTPACAISGSTVTVMLAPQLLTAAGETVADVVLLSGETALGSFSFAVRVSANPLGEAGLESCDYFSLARVNMAYEQLYNAIDTALEQVEKATETVKVTAVDLVPVVVDEWLTAHPEVTTTVLDGSITREKLAQDLLDSLGGGLSQTATALLIAILRSLAHTSEQSALIDALAEALAGGNPDVPDPPSTPDVPDASRAILGSGMLGRMVLGQF